MNFEWITLIGCFFSHLPLFYFVSFFFLVWSASYANPQNIKMPSIYNLCSPFAFLCTNLTTSRSRTYTYTHLLHIQTTQNFVNEIPNDSCGVRFKYILSQWIFSLRTGLPLLSHFPRDWIQLCVILIQTWFGKTLTNLYIPYIFLKFCDCAI